MHIAIVLFNGFDNIDAIGPFEVFNHARARGAEIDVGLYTTARQTSVTSSHGLRVEPDGVLDDTGTVEVSSDEDQDDGAHRVPDVVVVPGGGWGNRAEEGAWAQVERGDLPAILERLYTTGATVASVCTGALLLAHAGLTDGRPAVTHHGAVDDLRDMGAQVVDARVVDDGDLLTAGGITAGLDLALYLVEREFDSSVAHDVAAEMEYERRGSVIIA